MGSCLCKNKSPNEGENSFTRSDSNSSGLYASASATKQLRAMENALVDQLIMDMLKIVGCFSQSEDDVPAPLAKLHYIAEHDDGWSQVTMSLIHTIPLDEPLGPSAISIIFDDIPLPPKEIINNLVWSYELSEERALVACRNSRSARRRHLIQNERNILVILGCIAERFAGGISMEVLTPNTLDYLTTFLREKREPCLVLYALIALEKFARTSENKWTIIKYLTQQPSHVLLPLEHLVPDNQAWTTYLTKEVAFCAQWALDNIFVVEGRQLAYDSVDTTTISVMLNSKDVSEHLKISPDGLEARCDSHSFESVRCTFQSDCDCWYYEVEIITSGVMQIGWATKSSQFQNHDGFGVGDDSFSLSFDGCRRLIWYKAHPVPVPCIPQWKPGDILGCLIDVAKQEAIFSLNGERLPVCSEIFKNTREAYHAAASFMAHQQCRFNFGSREFMHPPQDRVFKKFNDYGTLCDSDKRIIPRRIIMDQLKNEPIVDGACFICCDVMGNCSLKPCQHSGMCGTCAAQLRDCPICRMVVSDLVFENP